MHGSLEVMTKQDLAFAHLSYVLIYSITFKFSQKRDRQIRWFRGFWILVTSAQK